MEKKQIKVKYEFQASLEDLELELWLRRRNSSQIVWTTKQGQQIPINQMSDEHLINTINMINRYYEEEDHMDCWNSETFC